MGLQQIEAVGEHIPPMAREMAERLMAELRNVKDPRVVSDDPPFEHPPFAGELPKRKK